MWQARFFWNGRTNNDLNTESGDTDKLIHWLKLKSVPGVGNLLFKRLLERFKSPEAVFEAAHPSLIRVDGISSRLAVLISEYKISDDVRREDDLIREKGCRIITLTDEQYPTLLREIPDPPPILYVMGNLESSVHCHRRLTDANALRNIHCQTVIRRFGKTEYHRGKRHGAGN